MSIIEQVKEYPVKTGIVSSLISVSSGIITIEAYDIAVKCLTLLSLIGGLFLTFLSIKHKLMMMKQKKGEL